MEHFLKLYSDAHKKDFQERYPQAWNDGHYSHPLIPRWKTANGLTTFIINYLNWSGHRATRIAASGRLIDSGMVMESGVRLKGKKWIPGSTRKGSSDISATIFGRSVMFEIKIGNDKPSPDQLKEQERERKAGGQYHFVKTPEQFFEIMNQPANRFDINDPYDTDTKYKYE